MLDNTTCGPTSSTGKCNLTPINQGGPCNADNSVCTVGDKCANGVCGAGSSLNCNDSNLCTTDSCEAADGCQHTANTNACNDNNACTGPDVCAGGSCTPPLKNCDDTNPCTVDSCNSGSGCINANVADKTICNTTGVCFTGICKPGVCGDGVIIASLGEQCDDGNTGADRQLGSTACWAQLV